MLGSFRGALLGRERARPWEERGNVIVSACAPEYLSRLTLPFMPRSRHHVCMEASRELGRL